MHIDVFLGLWLIIFIPPSQYIFYLTLTWCRTLLFIYIWWFNCITFIEDFSNIYAVDLQSTRLLKACIKAEGSAIFFFVRLFLLFQDISSPSVECFSTTTTLFSSLSLTALLTEVVLLMEGNIYVVNWWIVLAMSLVFPQLVVDRCHRFHWIFPLQFYHPYHHIRMFLGSM